MPVHTILIVDDDLIVRESIGALLDQPDTRLFFAEDGLEALKQARDILPDVILLDVMMPGMDGFEVCRRLRATPLLAEVPIVMVTALDDRESRLHGLEAGADDFLTKPVDYIELRTRVQTIVRLNRYRKLLEERTHFAQTLETKNRQLRELSQHLADVQEAERRFIATELHDDVGQLLTGLKLMIEMATTQAEPDRQETLKNARNTISELSTHVRNLSLDLRPAMLDDFGLFAALEWLFGRYAKQTGITVTHNFSFLDEHRFPKRVETAAFRIIQESLTNTARYAAVKEVEVNIVTNGRLRIKICDLGQGFDPTQAEGTSHQTGGISGMRERVAWVGGEFSILSNPGAGTTVLASFNLEGENTNGQD
jgi:signal transduction histidine kinase